MAANYEQCRHSVTVRTNDLGVLHMLRGLAQHCESGVARAAGSEKRRGENRHDELLDPAREAPASAASHLCSRVNLSWIAEAGAYGSAR